MSPLATATSAANLSDVSYQERGVDVGSFVVNDHDLTSSADADLTHDVTQEGVTCASGLKAWGIGPVITQGRAIVRRGLSFTLNNNRLNGNFVKVNASNDSKVPDKEVKTDSVSIYQSLFYANKTYGKIFPISAEKLSTESYGSEMEIGHKITDANLRKEFNKISKDNDFESTSEVSYQSSMIPTKDMFSSDRKENSFDSSTKSDNIPETLPKLELNRIPFPTEIKPTNESSKSSLTDTKYSNDSNPTPKPSSSSSDSPAPNAPPHGIESQAIESPNPLRLLLRLPGIHASVRLSDSAVTSAAAILNPDTMSLKSDDSLATR